MKNAVCLMAASAVAALLAAGTVSAHDDKMQMMDTDKDGRISAAEHASGARQMFQKMDTNGDGRVTAAEMDAYQSMKSDSLKGDDKGHKSMSSSAKIKAIDTNGDGAITAAEHEEGSRKMFSQMDTDGDGYVSSTEMQSGHDRMMKDKNR